MINSLLVQYSLDPTPQYNIITYVIYFL